MAQSPAEDNDSPRKNKRATDPDRPLVERAQRGDQQALAQLYRKYWRMVELSLIKGSIIKGRLALNHPLNTDEAEHVAQLIFTKAFKALPSFAYRSTFSTWLFRHVGPSVAKDYFRSQSQQRKVKKQAITDNAERQRLGLDTLDNDGMTAIYEIEVPQTIGLTPYWTGRKSIRLRPLERKRWLDHKVDPAKTKKALAHLWMTRNTHRTQNEWRTLALSCADMLTDLHPGRGRYPHPDRMGRGYFILTASDVYPTSEKGQALLLAGLLAALLPAPRGGRRPKSGLTLEMMLGIPSTKQV
jgi:DNA-directed RNA polymerase specialized sigma24 family protein